MTDINSLTKEELDRMTDPQAKKEKSFAITLTKEIPYLRKLHERYGANQAAEMLGLSQSMVSGMVAKGEARPAYEMAAKLIMGAHEKKSDYTVLILKVPNERLELLQTFLKGMGDIGFSQWKF